MSELVERLRRWSVFGYGHEASCDMKEAADRIAQLEAALREIDTISWTPTDRETYQDLFAEAQNIASAALEDKP